MTTPGSRFDGRVAVVTGAGSGLGAASARRLAAEGARLVLVDIDEEAAEAVSAGIDGETVVVGADIADEAAVDHYLERAVAAYGRIDHHHLNAGIFGSFVPLPDLSVDDFERVMAVNVRGQFMGLRGAFRQFSAQRGRGSVVITASIASLTGAADLFPYQVSKHAVSGLVHAGGVYGGPLGIRVNAVAPGFFASEMSAVLGANQLESIARRTPSGAMTTPEDVVPTVRMLLLEQTNINGQSIVIDGGGSI